MHAAMPAPPFSFYAKLHKLLCDVNGRHYNARNSDVSLSRAPLGKGEETADISDYSVVEYPNLKSEGLRFDSCLGNLDESRSLTEKILSVINNLFHKQ